MAESKSPLLAALRRTPADTVPVWFMRQAGRYLPEYRKLRETYSMLQMIREPEIAATVTLQPLIRFPLDAAIIFADILPPLIGMGLDLQFTPGEGPVINNPIRDTRDVDMLAVPPATEHLSATLEAIRIVKSEQGSGVVPLIGFAGAPFTLASYALEGGSSRSYTKTKSFMYREPAAWKRLMTRLVTVQADYLAAQAEAGADALQLFDSWVGIALGSDDYRTYVAPYTQLLIATVRRKCDVPIILFSTGTGTYIEEITTSGCDAVSVDFRIPLDDALRRIGPERSIQGNLDPAVLLAPWREIEARAERLLEIGARHPGYIFNLGHGILPETPVDIVGRLVDFVHERGSQLRSSTSAPSSDRTRLSTGAQSPDRTRATNVTRPATGSPGSSAPRRNGRDAAPIGVLMMAYGGPSSLDELPGYLADIRSGRPTSPNVLAEMGDHYQRIGGRSPLYEITMRQRDALAHLLPADQFRVYVGMRHWSPWIDEVVGQMAEDGIRRAVGLVLAPHYSAMSIGRYRERIEDGRSMYRADISFRVIEEYHENPGLIAALADRVRTGLGQFDPEIRDTVHVVFSAHSLPSRIIAEGDPYERQLLRTAELVAERSGLAAGRWSWSYQSAGNSPEPWLGPQLEEYIPQLASKGIRNVVSVPVGFVADHVEVLYDVDVEAQRAAHECGVRLVRPPGLNDDPGFMDALAALVVGVTRDWSGA